MDGKFSGSDIVEFGIEIEKNGRDLYNVLSNKFSDEKVKNTFAFLAGQEERHIEAFEKILESVKNFEPKEAYNDEYFAYMKSMADQHVFIQKGKGLEVAKSIESALAAIDFGLKFEMDSIEFFDEIKKTVQKSDQEIIQALINQEKEHVEKLEALKTNF